MKAHLNFLFCSNLEPLEKTLSQENDEVLSNEALTLSVYMTFMQSWNFTGCVFEDSSSRSEDGNGILL